MTKHSAPTGLELGTSMLFKRTEQIKHDVIHDDDIMMMMMKFFDGTINFILIKFLCICLKKKGVRLIIENNRRLR